MSPELQAYYYSPEWKKKKQYFLARDKCCRLCGSDSSLEIHHIRYAHVYHEELFPEDCIVLCNKCHSIITLYWRIADSLKEFYNRKRKEL